MNMEFVHKFLTIPAWAGIHAKFQVEQLQLQFSMLLALTAVAWPELQSAHGYSNCTC